LIANTWLQNTKVGYKHKVIEMNKMIINDAEKFKTRCFSLNGILYVKHAKYEAYVYPGFNLLSAPLNDYQLIKAGAEEVFEMLYRTTQKAIR
jgi:PP-loop superfamily ATP-utilizing enzyme